MRVLSFDKAKSSISAIDLVEEISRKVPSSVQIDILKETYPNGKIRGNQFVLGSLAGEEGNSLKIDITPGPFFLKGTDFNGGEGVGGIVKVMMEGKGMTLPEIKEHFAGYLDESRRNVRDIEHQYTPTNPFNTSQPAKQKYDINTPHDGEHEYVSADGEIIAMVRRYNVRDENGNVIIDASGKAKKEFRQFVTGTPYPKMPETRPLYNIPNISSSDRVIWVEGEKCADALNQLGFTATCHMGGAGMLSRNSAPSYDFSPLHGKEVILWPDNDKAGRKVAELVQQLALQAGAKSVTTLTPPQGKPEKWDAADAIAESFNVRSFLNDVRHKSQRSINLLDDSLLVSRFSEQAPEQKFLINNIMPLGIPALFSAAGDSGKGMMTMDLAMKISSGRAFQNSFGGQVGEFGNTIIFTAEDDEAEVHRRIARLDPSGERFDYEHQMRIIPLPNYGGVFPIMQQGMDKSYHSGEEFEKYYDQILQIKNLKLIVFDPLASFVHADVNADPAAGAALMGLMAKIATETGATVLLCHHMAKVKDNDPPKTPEEARNLIRGTSALVDGVRFAYAIWNVTTKIGKDRAKTLGIDYTRNGFFDGAVVKSNGPASREIRRFVRDSNTGLLVDHSEQFVNVQTGDYAEVRIEALYNWIRDCEVEGKALTQDSGTNRIIERLEERGAPDILRGYTYENIRKNYLKPLVDAGRVAKYNVTGQGGRIWLGVEGGTLSQRTYTPTTARDNV
jgi:5S rRNA maturation endonuclease (ribonuclease M5)